MLEINDRVCMIGEGRTSPNSCNIVKKLSGFYYIKHIVRGASYPYELTSSNGKVIGYFKESAIQKI